MAVSTYEAPCLTAESPTKVCSTFRFCQNEGSSPAKIASLCAEAIVKLEADGMQNKLQPGTCPLDLIMTNPVSLTEKGASNAA